MLMRYIDRINPVDLWRTLSDDQRETLCTSIADIWSQLMCLRFKFIASIYEQQEESESRYFIGPMAYLPQAGSIGSPEACTSRPFSSSRDLLVTAVIDAVKNTPLLGHDSPGYQQIVLSHIDYSLHNILVDRDDPTQSSLWLTGRACAPSPCGLPIHRSCGHSCCQKRRSATSSE
ncbi:hypothetical protein F5146DRAFT_1069837 [Armillaria mellea]|nr:hypothetical protein F5146DRAFT_1069837 [Armillaria mellea]